jgi:protein-S-isoprenylcysteine O-methyltransferase Ste14
MASDQALPAAAWAGVAGISLALAGALALMIAERRPMDRGLWVLIAAGFVLAVPSPWAPPIMLGVVVLLTFATNAVVSREQKERLRDQLSAGWRKLAGLAGPT